MYLLGAFEHMMFSNCYENILVCRTINAELYSAFDASIKFLDTFQFKLSLGRTQLVSFQLSFTLGYTSGVTSQVRTFL